MPYTIRGKCIYKKDGGSKVGCTKGDVHKYLAALHANANESEDKALNEIRNFIRIVIEENMDDGRPLGKSLSKQISSPYVIIYRAAPMIANEFFNKDYVTLSKKFAIEHAENNHVYHDEPYHVIQALVSTENVFDAHNPGEYFYSGPNKKAKEIYVSLGPDEYEGLD